MRWASARRRERRAHCDAHCGGRSVRDVRRCVGWLGERTALLSAGRTFYLLADLQLFRFDGSSWVVGC